MWIEVRSMDGTGRSHKIPNLSKRTKVEELRKTVAEKFDAPPDRIRLFYAGKQLEDGYELFAYNVSLNDVVQVLISQVSSECQPSTSGIIKENKAHTHARDADKENEPTPSSSSVEKIQEDKISCESKYYKVGDLVDALDSETGAWFPAKILSIQKKRNAILHTSSELTNPSEVKDVCASAHGQDVQNVSDSLVDDGLDYIMNFEGYEGDADPVCLPLRHFRPRAMFPIKFDDVTENSKVLVNYNIEKPTERGYWYDAVVTKKKSTENEKELIVTLQIGFGGGSLDNCKIIFTEEVFPSEKHKFRDMRADVQATTQSPVVRASVVSCLFCQDHNEKNCKHCGCVLCGGKEEPQKQLMCDECNQAYHLWCLKPPLSDVPEGDWYCPDCKIDETEVVKAGEKLKESKKKAKMASAHSSSKRDWGRGMACTGRTKECTIVPPTHFGPIPGQEVGTLWKYRIQASEAGVHRPHVAGIHGRETVGAYSIVLAGGYEDDVDNGETFLYTGSGGRDLSGNKRTADQTSNQSLTRMNKALALNCAAPLNTKTGAEAKNWQDGKPVRVIRSYKGCKHSKYCPEEGIRYDGIYKVVKYWPEKGRSGFLVWKYLLQRDDPVPAPWTAEGRKRVRSLGIQMQYPAGYSDTAGEKGKLRKSKDSQLRKRQKSAEKVEERGDEDSDTPSSAKKSRTAFKIPLDLEKLMSEDKNAQLWEQCKVFAAHGSKAFLDKVQEEFTCVCCQELVSEPITTSCFHNVCKSCLKNSFKAQIFSCPLCREPLSHLTALREMNEVLQKILLRLFPGYNVNR